MDRYMPKWNRISSSLQAKLGKGLHGQVGSLNHFCWRESWDSRNLFLMKYLIIFRNLARLILKNVGIFIAHKMMIAMYVNNTYIFKYFLIEKRHILIFKKLLIKTKYLYWKNYTKLIALMVFNMDHLYFYHQ